MDGSAEQGTRGRWHPGWTVLGSAVFVLFALGAVRFSYGVLFRSILDEFGWDRSTGAWAYSVNMWCFALTLPVSGALYDRFGPRRLLGLFGMLLLAGIFLSARAQDLGALVIGYGLLAGVGFGGLGPTLLATIVGRWFAVRTGFLMSLGFAGIAAGQLALLGPVAWTTEHLGWRPALAGLGTLLGVAVGAALWLVRDSPAEVGLRRVGEGGAVRKTGGRPGDRPAAPDVETVGFRAALATCAFWVICLVYAVCGFTDFLVDLHVVPLLLDRGGTLVTGGTVKAVMGAASFFGVLLSGWLSDRMDERIPLAASFALRMAIFLAVILSPGHGAAVGFAVLYGFSFMASAPITTVLVRRRYGVGGLALLTGFVTFVHHAAGGLGAYVGGAVFDRFGSYAGALALAAALSAAAAGLSLAISKRRAAVAVTAGTPARPGGGVPRGGGAT